MRPNRLWALSLCAVVADATFPDTSPFFALTTSPSPEPFSDLPDGVNFLPGTKLALALDGVSRGCASDAYILVSQPGVSAADFSSKTAAPNLSRRLGFGYWPDPKVTYTSIVPEVVGLVDPMMLRKRLQTTCKASLSYLQYSKGDVTLPDTSRSPSILLLDFPELPSTRQPEARAARLTEHDAYLNTIIEKLPSTSYTLIITTTPVSQASALDKHTGTSYDTDTETQHFPLSALHTDLKRQLHNKRQDAKEPEDVEYNDRALFEKYSFLNAGMFMGILTMIILGSILSVGVSAIAGLQVSYGSFTKEMGQAGKKQ